MIQGERGRRCCHVPFRIDNLGLVNLEAMITWYKAGLLLKHPASHLTGYIPLHHDLTRTGKDVPVK
jgi:hypothetical protein